MPLSKKIHDISVKLQIRVLAFLAVHSFKVYYSFRVQLLVTHTRNLPSIGILCTLPSGLYTEVKKMDQFVYSHEKFVGKTSKRLP